MILSVTVKSDKTFRATFTSWTAVSWTAWASTLDHLQSLLVATKYIFNSAAMILYSVL